jgi:AraC-like DNA-binding protein
VLWIGTNGSGLKRLANGTASSFTTGDGLPGNFIYSIREEGPGLLWFGCEAGVFGIRGDSLAAHAAGELSILAPTLYDDSDGMPSDRCNGLCYPAVCASRSGRVYYPTKGGIAVFEGQMLRGTPRDSLRETPRPPTVVVESVTVGDVEMRADGEIELSHGTDRVAFTFSVPRCSAPEKCRFVFRLHGYDDGFTALHPDRGRTAVYRDLPPGEYSFAVWAIENGGFWSEEAATVSFAVASPFYRSGSFAGILAAGIALAGGGAAALVQHRRMRRRRMKYRTSTISGERMEKAAADLNVLMDEERVYLDPDLTLKKLARRLNIHSNHLSRIINEQCGMSFNNYINRHRISEARRRLADPALRNKSILDIMYDVGFYSKSTFNTAFKKFTGESPSAYRKKHT